MPGKFVIRPIPISRMMTEKCLMTYRMNFGQRVNIVCYVWSIEGPDANIIVDAGCTAEAMKASYGFDTEHIQSLEEGLGSVGLKPEDIDTVILTHLHFDHVAMAHSYPNAQFVVQKTELDTAQAPHPSLTSYNQWSRSAWEGLNFKLVDGDADITAGVRVMLTPGHAPGAQSVAVDTAGGTAIIAGLCCLQENYETSPIVPPGTHHNLIQAYDSMVKVMRQADTIIALHDERYLHQDRIS